ncbi:hypothetical protein [Cupriavidus necator]
MAPVSQTGLIATEPFVAAVAEVVAAFLGGRGGAVAVNDRQIEASFVMKPVYRARKDCVEAAVSLPAAQGAVDAGIVNLGSTRVIRLDRQAFPLTSHVQ